MKILDLKKSNYHNCDYAPFSEHADISTRI